jgi:5-methylcytosine-specific restriction endonuclease McrA
MEGILDQPVLVLNRLWQAVNTCSVRRAFTLLYQGHAQVVSTDGANNYLTHDFMSWRDFSQANPEAEMVRTISVSIRIPRIIVLLLFERLPKKEVKFTRHNVFERDRNTCQYCRRGLRRHELNLDHVLPRDRSDRRPGRTLSAHAFRATQGKATGCPTRLGFS